MITQEQILSALKNVKDPDLNRDIVALGFVKDITIDGGKIIFNVELTTPACPVKEQLRSQCEEEVKKIAGVSAVEISMTSRIPANKGAAGQNNILPTVKNVIAVASGKGGVGKSTVATNIAVALGKLGAKVGLLDADIYGPSIPLMMGIQEKPKSSDGRRMDPIFNHGIYLMSIGFLMPEDQALVWRGPMVAQALTQLMRDVAWPELDYLIVDMPPGTGDAQLTLSQVVHLVGAVIVTTPQDVALIDAKRGVGMFQKVNVPILGIIENMSYYVCPNCNHRTEIFSHGGAQKAAQKYEVPFLGEVPLDIETRLAGDNGMPIVLAKPDSVNAKALLKVAQNLAATISVIHYGTAEDRSRILGQNKVMANARLKVI